MDPRHQQPYWNLDMPAYEPHWQQQSSTPPIGTNLCFSKLYYTLADMFPLVLHILIGSQWYWKYFSFLIEDHESSVPPISGIHEYWMDSSISWLLPISYVSSHYIEDVLVHCAVYPYPRWYWGVYHYDNWRLDKAKPITDKCWRDWDYLWACDLCWNLFVCVQQHQESPEI